MEKEKIKEIIKQVLYNPQASYPPISYESKDVPSGYKFEYIDKIDFNEYLKRLEEQLIIRLT